MTPPIGRLYRKDFDVAGNKFTVQIQFQGNIPSGHLGQFKDTWLFVLLVNGDVVEMGPWYDLQDRHPTNEQVCEALAIFWGDTHKIREAQELSGSPSNEEILENLVFECADWMHGYFEVDPDDVFRDFEIVSKHVDENGWEIYLSPNYKPNRVVRFTVADNQQYVTVRVFTSLREIKTIL